MIQHKKNYNQDAKTTKTSSPVVDRKTAIFHRPSVWISTPSIVSVKLSSIQLDVRPSHRVCSCRTQDITYVAPFARVLRAGGDQEPWSSFFEINNSLNSICSLAVRLKLSEICFAGQPWLVNGCGRQVCVDSKPELWLWNPGLPQLRSPIQATIPLHNVYNCRWILWAKETYGFSSRSPLFILRRSQEGSSVDTWKKYY